MQWTTTEENKVINHHGDHDYGAVACLRTRARHVTAAAPRACSRARARTAILRLNGVNLEYRALRTVSDVNLSRKGWGSSDVPSWALDIDGTGSDNAGVKNYRHPNPRCSLTSSSHFSCLAPGYGERMVASLQAKTQRHSRRLLAHEPSSIQTIC